VWLVREGKKFVDLKPGADGILRSKKFPGLWLDPAALIAGDKRRVNEVLNQGLASPEHAKFVAEIAKQIG
jgi:hypothetical protein